MSVLARGMDYVDLNFLGRPGIIATAVLSSPGGVALVDPGPSTSLETLMKTLGAQIAIAVENARLYEAQQVEAYYLNALLNVAE